MIKRSGVIISSVVPKKETQVLNLAIKNVVIAKETMKVCEEGMYTLKDLKTVDIAESLSAAVNGTVYHIDIVPVDDGTKSAPQFEVINEKTAEAAERLIKAGAENIVALNFASGRNPGGGFLGGAKAQEEDLCRASGLYPCLLSKPKFYNANIICDSEYYTDGIIYSPKVPFFRDKDNEFLEKPFELSIITYLPQESPRPSGFAAGEG